jgi:hypothetical protein
MAEFDNADRLAFEDDDHAAADLRGWNSHEIDLMETG